MTRLAWVFRYAWLAYRSPYDISFIEAWGEGWASWEMNESERGNDPMPSPADALYWDQYEWSDRA